MFWRSYVLISTTSSLSLQSVTLCSCTEYINLWTNVWNCKQTPLNKRTNKELLHVNTTDFVLSFLDHETDDPSPKYIKQFLWPWTRISIALWNLQNRERLKTLTATLFEASSQYLVRRSHSRWSRYTGPHPTGWHHIYAVFDVYNLLPGKRPWRSCCRSDYVFGRINVEYLQFLTIRVVRILVNSRLRL